MQNKCKRNELDLSEVVRNLKDTNKFGESFVMYLSLLEIIIIGLTFERGIRIGNVDILVNILIYMIPLIQKPPWTRRDEDTGKWEKLIDQ